MEPINEVVAASRGDPPPGGHRSPLSAQDKELMALPSIASQMPVRFRNGACWDSFEGQCKACGRSIDQAWFRGRVTRLVESVASVEAVGICHPCGLLTRFHYRLHDDMHISGLTDEGWAKWEFPPTLFGRLCKWLGHLLS